MQLLTCASLLNGSPAVGSNWAAATSAASIVNLGTATPKSNDDRVFFIGELIGPNGSQEYKQTFFRFLYSSMIKALVAMTRFLVT